MIKGVVVRCRKLALQSIVLAVIQLLAGLCTNALADFTTAQAEFSRLSDKEKIWLQINLAATGDYNALYTDVFSSRLYRAITAFQNREGRAPNGVPDSGTRVLLSARGDAFFFQSGFKERVHPIAGSSLMVPMKFFDVEKKIPKGFAFERNDGALSLSFVYYPSYDKTYETLFRQLTELSFDRAVIYKVFKPQYFVSSGKFKGRNYYTWMSAISGGSTGFTLAWSSDMRIEAERLSILLANVFSPTRRQSEETVERGESNDVEPAPLPPAPKSKADEEIASGPSSGTGFVVTLAGHILTNHHVIEGCRHLTVQRPAEAARSAVVVAGDKSNDLALLKVDQGNFLEVVSFRKNQRVRAGEGVVVFGYPLAGALTTTGNVVTGNVTALAGLKNDSRFVQISAPVQPGNSGGALLDYTGAVIGVVQSKLNAMVVAEATGDIPQNVNFAIRGNLALNFLDSNGVEYTSTESVAPLSTTDIADMAKRASVYIECR